MMPSEPVAPVTFREALAFWFKLGFISFGGPAGQIALLHQELVERRRWISEKRFLHALNYCMVLPGPEAQQLVTYIGWLMHRSWGGVVAGSLFVLPSLAMLIGLSWVYVVWGNLPWVAGLFAGIKPAVAAIVLQAAYRIGSRTLRNPALMLVALLSFLATSVAEIPFPWVVLGAALTGWGFAWWHPQDVRGSAPHASAQTQAHAPAWVDDHTPPPLHARFSWQGLVRVLGWGALLWLLPMAGLAMSWGWEHTLTQMGWFFTKAAWLTFGGAYAVLPYVVQGAVDQYAWLTAPQMMDGLALGESTPGPLIMVVAFVGFLGGVTKEVLGPDTLVASGALAACLVTWFTFLPSFILILAGGPWIESTHGQLKFTAPLTAITAAVVGVVLNLALFFLSHVGWPEGLAGRLDVPSLVLFAAATVALLYFKRGVLEVMGICAALGWAWTWLG
jgi:chromate transporter